MWFADWDLNRECACCHRTSQLTWLCQSVTPPSYKGMKLSMSMALGRRSSWGMGLAKRAPKSNADGVRISYQESKLSLWTSIESLSTIYQRCLQTLKSPGRVQVQYQRIALVLSLQVKKKILWQKVRNCIFAQNNNLLQTWSFV